MKLVNCGLCGSQNLEHNQEFGFYQCLDCGNLYGSDDDDPDYGDIEELSSEEKQTLRDYEIWIQHGLKGIQADHLNRLLDQS